MKKKNQPFDWYYKTYIYVYKKEDKKDWIQNLKNMESWYLNVFACILPREKKNKLTEDNSTNRCYSQEIYGKKKIMQNDARISIRPTPIHIATTWVPKESRAH